MYAVTQLSLYTKGNYRDMLKSTSHSKQKLMVNEYKKANADEYKEVAPLHREEKVVDHKEKRNDRWTQKN